MRYTRLDVQARDGKAVTRAEIEGGPLRFASPYCGRQPDWETPVKRAEMDGAELRLRSFAPSVRD